MRSRRRIFGGLMGIVGYVLSPLSWWNDAFVNIPLAYLCGWLASLAYQQAFLPVFVLSYWITNIAGFVLLHKGVEMAARKEGRSTPYSRRSFMKDLALSVAYTALIVGLVRLHLIKPVGSYF
ncbi:MAG: hypothetical protein U0411_02585 [Thermodesulfovibrionales bacterium]